MAMNTTGATIDNITSPAESPVTSPSGHNHLSNLFRNTLIVIYSVVLLVGVTGLTLMISLLKANIRSLTTIAFLNLIVAHFLFLITVPFRIYYYTHETWNLGPKFCKLVSAMVHLHMYMVFTIYAILLTLRFLQFYKKTQRTEFYRRLHALCASALVWFLLLLIMVPLVLSQYGKQNVEQHEKVPHTSLQENQIDDKKCFNFEGILGNKGVYVLNMILSLVIITVSCIQACVQAVILRTMILKYGNSCRSQQEFWVQMKNLSFVLIMLTFLVPYHLFRLEYLRNPGKLNQINDVFLAITGLTCFDMLTFMGKGMCKICCT